MKITLVLFAVVLFTDAAMFSDNDVDSPLVSYLLAKMQRLESKIMTRPNAWEARPSNIKNSRSTRQATAKSVKARSTSAESNCPSNVVTYIRWGSSSCPFGADIIYSGFAAGSWWEHQGAAANPLCLPPDPKYLKYKLGYQGWARLHGVEYETGGTPLDHSHDRNMPCALCQVYGRSNKIMIPSHYECPSGWRREYYGYLMAGGHQYNAASEYNCIDESLEQIPGSGADDNGYLLFRVEAYCGSYIPCSDKELTCVVCTK